MGVCISQYPRVLSPSQVNAKPVVWFRADAGVYQDVGMTTPVVHDGDTAAAWADKSGNGYNLTEYATPASWSKTGIGGLPAVNFSAFGQLFIGTYNVPANVGINTTFMVMNYATEAGGNASAYLYNSTTAPSTWVPFRSTNSGTPSIEMSFGAGGTGKTTLQATDPGSGTARVFTAVMNGANSALKINNVAIASGTLPTNQYTAFDGANQRMSLGGVPNVVLVSEILIYAKILMPWEEQGLYGYLKTKYGL